MQYDNARRKFSASEVVAGALILGLAVAIVYPVLRTCPAPKRTSCMNYMKQIGTCVLMYEDDWGDRLPRLYTKAQIAPEGKAWPDLLRPHTKNKKIFECPKAKGRLTYSFNRRMSGVKYGEVAFPADRPLVFDSVNDSKSNDNLNGDSNWISENGKLPTVGAFVGMPWDEKDVPKWARPSHEDSNNVLYVDGHAMNYALWPGRRPELDFSPK